MSQKGRKTRLVDELFLQSVADEFRIALHIHLLKHAGTIRADDSNAQEKFFTDFLDRLSRDDHAHDLILTV